MAKNPVAVEKLFLRLNSKFDLYVVECWFDLIDEIRRHCGFGSFLESHML